MYLYKAVVRDYMLEKSRVVHQSSGEGIFHIFYALFAGCPKDTKSDLFLTSQAGEYRFGNLFLSDDSAGTSSTVDSRYLQVEGTI